MDSKKVWPKIADGQITVKYYRESICGILAAIRISNTAHKNMRKAHPDHVSTFDHAIEVCQILADSSVKDIDILTAAILHDILEITDLTANNLRNMVNIRTFRLVQELTACGKYTPGNQKSYLENMMRLSPNAKLIKLADLCFHVGEQINEVFPYTEDYMRSYFIWCWYVCTRLTGVCWSLNKYAENIFERFNITDMNDFQLEHEVNKFYKMDINNCKIANV